MPLGLVLKACGDDNILYECDYCGRTFTTEQLKDNVGLCSHCGVYIYREYKDYS